MTTLISVHNSDGLVGRCDARCHDATSEDCDCVCGGRNHGVGEDQAIENTREMAEIMVDEYAREHALVPGEWRSEIPEDVYQLSMF